MAGDRIQVRQFRYASDNLGYLIHGQKSAMAVDGGAVDAILEFIAAHNLRLKHVTQTHTHADHMCGHQSLIDHTGATHLDAQALSKRNNLMLEGQQIEVHPAPGHTEDSVVFYTDDILLTGDTLFNGNVGSCLEGGMQRLFETIKMVMDFPGHTLIYAGHDYVSYSMTVARLIEPENPHIDRFLKKYNPRCVYSSLVEERQINPYVRFNDPAIISILKAKGLPHATEYERWESVMSLP